MCQMMYLPNPHDIERNMGVDADRKGEVSGVLFNIKFSSPKNKN